MIKLKTGSKLLKVDECDVKLLQDFVFRGEQKSKGDVITVAKFLCHAMEEKGIGKMVTM